VEEAAAIFELWMKDRAMHSCELVSFFMLLDANVLGFTAANDELFLAKYTEASGNARDFTMKGILSTLGGT
jgi:small subunit ribosomal protein S29